MSIYRDVASSTDADAPQPKRRPQTNVRALLVLVACCAVVLWAWRHAAENSDPVKLEALSIQNRAISALLSGKPSERIVAIFELERLGFGDGSVAISALVQACDDPDMAVRAEAARALGLIVPSVLKSRSGDGAVRAATKALIAHSKGPDEPVRMAAVVSLGLIAASAKGLGTSGEIVHDSVAALIESLKDPRPKVRSLAVSSLGSIASSRASIAASAIDRQFVMGKLVEMLRDRDADVRLTAIEAVASFDSLNGPPRALAEALKDESAKNRAAAVMALGWAREGLDPWASVLLRLADHDPDVSVRKQCLWTLGSAFHPPAITPAIVPELIASLKSADAGVRQQAIALLGGFGRNARAAVPQLIGVLKEPYHPQPLPTRSQSRTFDPACEAAEALGRIAPGMPEAKQAISALMEAARFGPEERRNWAAGALGEFGTEAEEAVPVLIQLLKDASSRDGYIRGTKSGVLQALGKIAPGTASADQAVAALAPFLRSKYRFIKVNAIDALGGFGPWAVAAAPALQTLKGDRDPEIRRAAAKALFAIEGAGAPGPAQGVGVAAPPQGPTEKTGRPGAGD